MGRLVPANILHDVLFWLAIYQTSVVWIFELRHFFNRQSPQPGLNEMNPSFRSQQNYKNQSDRKQGDS